MAVDNPKVFLELIGNRETPTPSTTPTSTVNTAAGMESKKRDRKFYEHMKQTDPKKYFTQETRNQMMKDAMSLGADF